ncbi:hypothetical protein [Streptomyces sp. ISL-11]|uniref:hypothetical protein n=1 Tax=Streptomyces sp. ISL-11 TaxID=2819174 RepID=UPI001BE4E7AE|nr:hypothetical protein [Streptomyces sp. ISL-11]MBT2385951.1 hypothetical protein [Streptomyces sp. ISL-11]
MVGSLRLSGGEEVHDMADDEAAAPPEAAGALALEYRDGVLVLKLTGGHVIPRALPVVDDSGVLLAVYTAGTPAPGPASEGVRDPALPPERFDGG